MHIILPADAEAFQSRQAAGQIDEAIDDLWADPVWQALRSGDIRLPLAPQFSDDEVRSLLDKLREPNLIEQLEDLLAHLPKASQHLLDALQETHLQNA